MDKKLITAAELAEKLGVSKATVKRWRRAKMIPWYGTEGGTNLYDFEEVMKVLKKGKE